MGISTEEADMTGEWKTDGGQTGACDVLDITGNSKVPGL